MIKFLTIVKILLLIAILLVVSSKLPNCNLAGLI